ncbi:MAG: patatin-like phospholipase family protein [Balneolaceae bacterium]|nr:patatin-like phospholipase family protein [Balneolaceae bacterium]
MKKKIQLVLGSGGARGIAHIAVIEELEKTGHEIVEIVGCSMGAVIGGIYAAGQLEDYKKWLFSLDRNQVFDLTDFTFKKQGFVKGEKIFAKHREMTGDLNIEDFKIPFTAIAADVREGKEVLFKKGDLYKALRASVSIPGVFVPVEHKNRLLVDGGILNPLPLNVMKKREDATLVAVDLNSFGNPLIDEIVEDEEKSPKWFEQLIPDNIIQKTRFETKKGDSLSVFDLMESTFVLTQDRLKDLMIKVYPPDVLVNIPRKTCSTFEFWKAEYVYNCGLQAFKNSLNEIPAVPDI